MVENLANFVLVRQSGIRNMGILIFHWYLIACVYFSCMVLIFQKMRFSIVITHAFLAHEFI